MNNASDYESCVASLALAEDYPFVYASVGWHPHEARFFTEQSEKQLRGWCANPRVRAIGEIGLDYYYDHSERDVQRAVFARQLALARELDMPVVVHDRDAHADCMEIIRRFPGVRGEFHCYSGSAEMAREILELGWYLGFGGSITFKNARKALEVLKICPDDRILIETDCPYLAPVPHRGERNDSRLLSYVAEKIGEIKDLSAEAVAELTFENGKRFFGLV
jgi:TatD DNase family protein